jgi:hypothetical protein
MPLQKRPNASKSETIEDDEELSEDASLVEGNDDHPEKDSVPTTSLSSTLTHRQAKAQAQPQPQPQPPLQRLRRFLKFYVSFIASASHQDQALKVLQWTLWLLSTSCSPTRSQARGILRKYYLDIGYARYAARLLGLPAACEAVLSGSWATSSPSHPQLARHLGNILATSMLGYYPAEYGSYAIWMMPSHTSIATKHRINRTAERLSAWSCRFWLMYIVAETAQCALQWKDLRDEQKQQQQLKVSGGSDSSDDDDDDETTKDRRDRAATLQNAVTNTQLQLSRNALFFLPCIHWALPNWDRQPWLPEGFVNTLMWIESVTCLYQSVRRQPQQPAIALDVRPTKEE